MVNRLMLADPAIFSRLVPKGPSFLARRCFFKLPSLSDFAPNSGLQTYTVKKRINVNPPLLFKIVSDVSRYSEFVPFVEKSFINKYDEKTKLPTEGGLSVGWQEFDETFVCKLTCIQDESVVSESLSTSLFETLHNEWKFKEAKLINNTSCDVELTLRYKFNNPLYNTISSVFSDQVTKIMIEAFEKRALEVKVQQKFKDRNI